MDHVSELMACQGKEVEVIDLRSLNPLDMQTVIDSCKKTGRAVTVEESWRTGGFTGEIASVIHEEAFDYLDGPVLRIGGADVPSPYSSELEAATIPDAELIIRSIEKQFRF